TPLPKTPAVALILSVAFILTLGLSAAKGITLFETRATVIANAVPLRTGPNVEDNSIFDLIEGFDVVVRQVQNSWALITVSGGVSGWVPTDTLFQHTGKKRLW
ncbi:MAG: hypothetical protein KDD38_04815, partial [Bdellovibrionales bacterium]|nr:hypothetical protein [Bdellovibrionales bacterium]